MAANKADAILARFPGPVTLRVNRLKMLALLAGSLHPLRVIRPALCEPAS